MKRIMINTLDRPVLFKMDVEELRSAGRGEKEEIVESVAIYM